MYARTVLLIPRFVDCRTRSLAPAGIAACFAACCAAVCRRTGFLRASWYVCTDCAGTGSNQCDTGHTQRQENDSGEAVDLPILDSGLACRAHVAHQAGLRRVL